MAYEMRNNPGNRLGIFADKIEAAREQRGLTPAGFRLDGTDALKGEKKAMEREMYRRADAHLPPGIGGPVPKPDSETEVDQEDDE
jgi:hypothetical protein